ncbi:MAG: hypothetical protein Q7T57_01445, partial [Dehalococcoidales bacterium]|nr:hypothetical protein [Dehalococcoidales bacterium]
MLRLTSVLLNECSRVSSMNVSDRQQIIMSVANSLAAANGSDNATVTNVDATSQKTQQQTPFEYVSPPSSFNSINELYQHLHAHPTQLLIGRYEGDYRNTPNGPLSRLSLLVSSISPATRRKSTIPALGLVLSSARSMQGLQRQLQQLRLQQRAQHDDIVHMEAAEQKQEATVAAAARWVCTVKGHMILPKDGGKHAFTASYWPETGDLHLTLVVSQEIVNILQSPIEWVGQVRFTQKTHTRSNGGKLSIAGCAGPHIEMQWLRFEATLEAEPLIQPVVEGSPISSQPVQTLALVCRYLDSRDLIS